MNRKKTVAIIPARSGSKRLINKNFLELGGLPLFVHSIRYAQANQELIDEIIVSTDDATIKDIAINEGVTVIDRPSALAGDFVTTISVLENILNLDQYSAAEIVVLLQPTNPMRPENLLKEAMVSFKTHKVDSLFTCSKLNAKFGSIEDHQFSPENYTFGQRSQDLSPLYYENGLLYMTNANEVRSGTLITPKHYAMVVEHPYASIDIDTREDLDYAQFIWDKSQNK